MNTNNYNTNQTQRRNQGQYREPTSYWNNTPNRYRNNTNMNAPNNQQRYRNTPLFRSQSQQQYLEDTYRQRGSIARPPQLGKQNHNDNEEERSPLAEEQCPECKQYHPQHECRMNGKRGRKSIFIPETGEMSIQKNQFPPQQMKPNLGKGVSKTYTLRHRIQTNYLL